MSLERGKYIIFEAGDGSGKGTQIKLLNNFFDERGILFDSVREPGGTTEAELARKILLDKKYNPSERMEILLMEAARADLFKKKILPNLEQGVNIIADRSYVSSWVYQGYTRGLGTEFVEKLNDFATYNTKGDLIFIIDNNPKIGLANIPESEKDRLDSESLDFHQKVREGYLKFSKKHKNCVIIPYKHRDINGMQDKIREHVKKLLNL